MPVDEQQQATNKNGAQPDKQVAGKAENEKKPDDGRKPEAETKPDEKKPDDEKKPMDPARKRLWILLAVILGVVILVAGVLFYLHSLTYESTDDAQIDGHLNPIASRVAGTVKAVYVESDQPVKAGDPLVDLDPRDYEATVAQARAQYEQALAQLQAQNPNVPIQQTSNTSTVSTDMASVLNAEAAIASAQYDYDSNVAKLRQAEATNRKNQSDLVRYQELAAKHEIALSDLDQYVANAAAQEATVEASRSAAESSRKVVDSRRAQLQQQQAKLQEDSQNAPRQVAIKKAGITSSAANVASAKAQLDMALLNLSYCKIVSPVDGIASQRSAEVGGRVAIAQQLVVIVQTQNIWATANFKETQLRKMHTGQRVTVQVDSLSQAFEGKLEYMPAATGDRTSLFPPEDATGNYVRVVQRLPLRISLDPNQPNFNRLRPGMSVEAKVYLDSKAKNEAKSASGPPTPNR
jgi:membrane fusion protein (multidrug efflux system)